MTTQAFTLDAGSAAASVGEWVCKTASGTMTRALTAALTTYGAVFGCCVSAANPGTSVRVCFDGVLPPSITGLSATAGKARVNGSTARAERVASLGGSDYPIGDIDSTGHLEFEDSPESVTSVTDLEALTTPKHQSFVYVSDRLGHFRFDATSSATVGADVRAASDGSRGRWLFSGYTPAETGELSVSLSGSNRAAAINAALLLGDVKLSRGTYPLETAVVVPSNRRLLGAGSQYTILDPTFTPSAGLADDPTNYLISMRGAEDTSFLNTTLTVSAKKDGRSITVSNGGTLAAGQYFHIRGHNSEEGSINISSGQDTTLDEICQAASTHVTGATTIPLAWPLMQHHAINNGGAGVAVTVKGLLPVENARVEGVDLGCDGGTVAVGVSAKWAVRCGVRDVSGAGFSRAMLDKTGLLDWDELDCKSRGENNCWSFSSSVIGGRVDGWTARRGGKRFHANGVVRHAMQLRDRCVGLSFGHNRIEGTCGGICLISGQSIHLGTLKIHDTDGTEFIETEFGGNDRGIEVHGVAVMLGLTTVENNESGFGLTWDSIEVTNCRQPQLGSNDVGVAAVYLHDFRGLVAGHLSIVNDGLSPGQSGLVATGVRLQDAEGQFGTWHFRGVEWAVRTSGFSMPADIGAVIIDGIAGEGAGATTGFVLDHGLNNAFPRIKNLRTDNVANVAVINQLASIFGNAPDGSSELAERAVLDGYRFDHCVFGKNRDASTRAAGYIVERDTTGGIPTNERRFRQIQSTTTKKQLYVMARPCAAGDGSGGGNAWGVLHPIGAGRFAVLVASATVIDMTVPLTFGTSGGLGTGYAVPVTSEAPELWIGWPRHIKAAGGGDALVECDPIR